MTPIPSPSAVSLSTFKHALDLYPSLIEKVYKSKLKDPKKVADALQRDKWRFEELPSMVTGIKISKARQSGDVKEGGLTKEAVERLVQWKITHGHSRPFLPAMVRKNEASTVQTQTTLAFEKLLSSSASTPPTTASITAALELVCKLTGIGPATGTLILNICDPVHIPFFQDEMYMWFFPEAKGDKLRYNQKEYLQLLQAAVPVLKRLGVHAIDLEKVSYVFGHLELLEDGEREGLEDMFTETNRKETVPKESKHETINDRSSTAFEEPEQTTNAKKGRKRASKVEADEDTERPPLKRRSQRNK